ncbi:MAG: hypothetical protein WD689_08290 [Gaiellaceae bacterium]
MELRDELERVAAVAAGFAAPGEQVAGILAAEPGSGLRIYLCAYESGDGRSWLALDEQGGLVDSRGLVRDAASIAAMCELAAETAGGGQLEELRAQLVALRLRENPSGIDEAEEAALELERTVGSPPRVASPGLLDDIGAATRRLELALGGTAGSPFAEAMKAGMAAVDELLAEIEGAYKAQLG